MASEAGELVELFQWLTEEDSRRLDEESLRHVREEIADVLVYLLQLADKLGIDPGEAVKAKIEANETKYPIELARGNATKYSRRAGVMEEQGRSWLRIFVFTASRAEAAIHYDRTIKHALTDEDLAALPAGLLEQARSRWRGPIHAWGAVPGEHNTPLWRRLQPSDFVLAYRDGFFTGVLRVLEKGEDAKWARLIWDVGESRDNEGQTWSLFYLMKKIEDIHIKAYRQFRGHTGPLNKAGVEAVRASLGRELFAEEPQ